MKNIQILIEKTIQSLYTHDFSPEITPAPKKELGEYCINVFPLAKPLGKAPNIIAEEIAFELAKHTDTFTSTNSTGGYVNFFLTDSVWMGLFQGIVIASESEAIQNTKEQDFSLRSASLEMTEAKNQEPRTKNQPTIIVDYIGANVGKPLHIGHICTPSIGQVICNVYRHLGYQVIGDSHFGDWGGIFGKLIHAWNNPTTDFVDGGINDPECNTVLVTYSKSEIAEKRLFKKVLLEKYGVQYLVTLYQSFFEIIDESEHSKLEEEARKEFQYLSGIGIDLSNPDEFKHHEENVELWKKFTSISIAETEKKLDLLNVHATYNIGESFYEGLGLPRPNNEDYPDLKYNMKDVVAELIEKGIATQNEDGSVGVVFPEELKLPSCILQKKDGTGLYLTSDLAAIRYRLTNGWNPEKIIYSVDVRQQLHLKQAFTIAQMAWGEELGAKNVEFTHAFNGFIKLKEGVMSTRHGTVIFLEALIEEGNERTKKILEEKGRIGENTLSTEDIQAITIAAIKYSYLAQDREKDVTFDWDKALNFEGNSGPYIQYAYVRGSKLIQDEKGKIQNFSTNNLESRILNLSSFDKSLIQILAGFDEVIETVANTYKPHHLALYCYDVAVTFNSFYVHTPKILEEKDEGLRDFRLSLVQKTTETLKLGFSLLGINMPSEM